MVLAVAVAALSGAYYDYLWLYRLNIIYPLRNIE